MTGNTQAAKILDNHVEFDRPIVQLCFRALIEAMSARQTSSGSLLPGIIHFLKVTALFIGQDYSTATQCQVYPEPTMTWSIFSAPCVIITAVVQVVK